jgi:hypothetical protein
MLYFNEATISPWVLSCIHTQKLKLKYHIKNTKNQGTGMPFGLSYNDIFFLKVLKQGPFFAF